MPENKIQFIESLHVSIENSDSGSLLLVVVTGKSEKSVLGIPRLIPVNTNNTDGVFELDFILVGDTSVINKKLDCEIKVVFKLSELPAGIKAIKVNAEKNSDILPIDKYNV